MNPFINCFTIVAAALALDTSGDQPSPAATHSPRAPSRAERSPLGPGRPANSRFHGELFSLRARRRFAAYLRMRLLEMREEGLERAAEAVERSTPVEELLAPPSR